MKVFEVKVGGKSLDYRSPGSLDLAGVREFFENQYEVLKICPGGRHVLGEVRDNRRTLFLKLATSEGISEVTKVEYDWNAAFNRQVDRKSRFCVPVNVECGFYKGLFYLVTDKFDGRLIVDEPKTQKADAVLENADEILDFCEFIQGLKFKNLVDRFYANYEYKSFFADKVKSWLEAVPADVREKYRLDDLYQIVMKGVEDLDMRPRHGDFAPWHIFRLNDGKLGLIDGEHALAGGVENYDICYFIQRVFSVLEAPNAAGQIVDKFGKRNYELSKIKTLLAARAIGGFLDESLNIRANYFIANKFKDWILSL